MGTLGEYKAHFTVGMLADGYNSAVSEVCFAQIEGFAEYGVPESHAAAFALLTCASPWLKCRHPEILTCPLRNSYPMCFYAPAQQVRGAPDHAMEIRPLCVKASAWDNGLEQRSDGSLALRLGFGS